MAGTHIQRSALLPYLRGDLYAIVADVERYPEFLPWCDDVDLLSTTPQEVRARVAVGTAGVRSTFITANRMVPPERIELSLVEGPFQQFEGYWQFIALGDGTVNGTKMELDLRFEFARGNALLSRTFGAVFERAAASMVDSFCSRAHALLASGPGNTGSG